MLGNLHAKTACWGVSCRTTLPCEFPFAPHNEEVFIQRVHSVKHQHAVIFFFVNSESISLILLTGSF